MRSLALVLVLAFVSTAAASPARADGKGAMVEPGIDPWTSVPAALALAPAPPAQVPVRNRLIALGAIGGLYLGFSAWAYVAWYRDHPAAHGFELGDSYWGDGLLEVSEYSGGADKLGHAWATMVLARMSSQALRFGGWNRRHAALIGGGLSSTLFALIECADAYYSEFSAGDLGADVIGAAAAALLESSARADELFDFRVEYWPSDEYSAIVRGDPGRPELDLKKANFAEDYSGQTYLAALHLGAIHGLTSKRWARSLRYVDAVIGFRSNKYRPTPLPDEGAIPTQTLSLGLSLNLQAAFDRVLGGGGRTRRGVRALLHGWSELMNAPFTSYRPLSTSRSCAPPGCVPD